MRVVAGAVLFLLSFLGSTFAQVPKANIFVGYSYMSADVPDISSRQNLNGWEGPSKGKCCRSWGSSPMAAGITELHKFSFALSLLVVIALGSTVTCTRHCLARAYRRHLVVGAANLSGASSDFALASTIGGGLDFKIAPILGWRFQEDYIHTHFFGPPQGRARISTGVVFRF